MNTATLREQFKSARQRGVPLIAISTPDPLACMRTLTPIIEETADGPAVVTWDCAAGVQNVNKAGGAVATALGGSEAVNLLEVLAAVKPSGRNAKFPSGAALFIHNAHRFWDSVGVVQAIWNLRDEFKAETKTLILLCTAALLPVELQKDVLVFDEELPDEAQLSEIITTTYSDAATGNKIPDLRDDVKARAVEALSGLAAFPAEQVVAMNITRNGLNVAGLWARKKAMIDQTPGLSVDKEGPTFADVGGCDNIKEFTKALAYGKDRPRAIVRIDEIDKVMGGALGDTSGVSQDQLQQSLTYMEDYGIKGLMFIGPPGSSKSLISKAAGSEAGVPTISLDMGGLKSGLVGSSETNMRNALKVITAVSQGKALFIATCNRMASLPPELRRRYNYGWYFFDLPDETEREAIWAIHRNKYGIDPRDETPEDTGWTGAEIRNCCDIAAQLNWTLVKASERIVPVSASAAEEISKLRQLAHTKFISASYQGFYDMERASSSKMAAEIAPDKRIARKMTIQ